MKAGIRNATVAFHTRANSEERERLEENICSTSWHTIDQPIDYRLTTVKNASRERD